MIVLMPLEKFIKLIQLNQSFTFCQKLGLFSLTNIYRWSLCSVLLNKWVTFLPMKELRVLPKLVLLKKSKLNTLVLIFFIGLISIRNNSLSFFPLSPTLLPLTFWFREHTKPSQLGKPSLEFLSPRMFFPKISVWLDLSCHWNLNLNATSLEWSLSPAT